MEPNRPLDEREGVAKQAEVRVICGEEDLEIFVGWELRSDGAGIEE